MDSLHSDGNILEQFTSPNCLSNMTNPFTQSEPFPHLAPGSVMYGQPGRQYLPSKAVHVLFERSLTWLSKKKGLSVYDPFCGVGHLATNLGYLHLPSISSIYASDVNFDLLSLAERNLQLLTWGGLAKREQELKSLYNLYHKPIHSESLQHIHTWKSKIQYNPAPGYSIFQRDARKPLESNMVRGIDLIMAKLPNQWTDTELYQYLNVEITFLLSQLNENGIAVLINSNPIQYIHSSLKTLDFSQSSHFYVYWVRPNTIQ